MGLIMQRKGFAGSLIGGMPNTQECLDFCGEHKIFPDCKLIEAKEIEWAYQQLDQANKDGIRYVIDIEKSKANKEFCHQL